MKAKPEMSDEMRSPFPGVSKWTGTFTRLRSCIVPAEITEPPTSTMVDRLVEYFS